MRMIGQDQLWVPDTSLRLSAIRFAEPAMIEPVGMDKCAIWGLGSKLILSNYSNRPMILNRDHKIRRQRLNLA